MSISKTDAGFCAFPFPPLSWSQFLQSGGEVVIDQPGQEVAVRVTSTGVVAVALQDWRRSTPEIVTFGASEAASLARALLDASTRAATSEAIATAKWSE